MTTSAHSPQPSALELVRNIGIIAHIDAGKTTLSERMLFYTQKIHRMGEVHDGTATMDFMPEEQERGITIAAAATSCQWQGYTLNLVDTPGHVDFTIEVERSLRVLDGAVGVFCAVGGVEPQSETVWRQSERFEVPKLAFINKIDRVGADFAQVLVAMRQRLGAKPVLLNMPLYDQEQLALVDLISMEHVSFDQGSQGREFARRALSEAEQQVAAPWRETMLESLAESDEQFFEEYLGGSYNTEQIHAALRRACLARGLTPVLTGSALKNVGVQALLDAVVKYLPAPTDVPATSPAIQGHVPDSTEMVPVPADPKAPFVGLIFKVLLEGGRKLSLLRIYSGTLKEGDSARNVTRKVDERISRIYRLHADRREQLTQATAGDIVAVLGLRSATTGDTMTESRHQILLERLAEYPAVISMAMEPRNADEGKALDEALERYCVEDPTLSVTVDEGSGHRIVSGMGELHLEVLRERIQREYSIAPRTGQPQVVTRETITATATGQGLFDRELGTVHHHGEVEVRVQPLPRNSGNRVLVELNSEAEKDHSKDNSKDKASPKSLPTTLIEAARQGVEDSLLSGPLGYPMQDVEVRILSLLRKEGLTSPAGCHMAAGLAMRQAFEAAQPVRLEPIMQVEISVPDENLGSSLSLFGAVGGKVENLVERGGMKLIQGRAAMRQLFGFSTSLRSATQGRAGLLMKFDTFDRV